MYADTVEFGIGIDIVPSGVLSIGNPEHWLSPASINDGTFGSAARTTYDATMAQAISVFFPDPLVRESTL